MRGLARVGAAFAYSQTIEDQTVTAVGEVPAATVQAIAGGVKRQEPVKNPSLSRSPDLPATR
jgi:sigma-E factor negative regulatory protein RseB